MEDVFYVLTSRDQFPRGRSGLGILANLVEQVSWPAALKIHRQTTGYQPKAGHQTTFRVISRLFGQYTFHRKETQFRTEKAIQKENSRWVLVPDNSVLEIWVTIFGLQQESRAMVGLRLSDSRMRHRTYKLEHLPASLRPTVAAAMVMLSDPQAGDIFLDPMCGAGTILIERAYWGRYHQLLGGDIDPYAVGTTETNVGERYKPIRIQVWDATNMTTLKSRSVNKVVCNLPFGRQIGSRQSNELLYARFLAEMARVLKPGGRMVLLTGDMSRLQENLKGLSTFKYLESHPLRLLGVRAKVFVMQKM